MAGRSAVGGAVVGLVIALAYVAWWAVLSSSGDARSRLGSGVILAVEGSRVIAWPASIPLMAIHEASAPMWWAIVLTASVANAAWYALLALVLAWFWRRVRGWR